MVHWQIIIIIIAINTAKPCRAACDHILIFKPNVESQIRCQVGSLSHMTVIGRVGAHTLHCHQSKLINKMRFKFSEIILEQGSKEVDYVNYVS